MSPASAFRDPRLLGWFVFSSPPPLQMFHEVNCLSVTQSKRKFQIFEIRYYMSGQAFNFKCFFGLSSVLYTLGYECVSL